MRIMSMRLTGLLFALLEMATVVFTPPAFADELRLRNGTVISGKLLAADEKSIVFKTAEGLFTKSREETAAIFLGDREAATGALPPGLSAASGLEIKRWTTFRRITNFQRGADAQFISNSKISADGSKIIYSTYRGTYVVNADGSGLVQLSDKRNGGGLIDISADAKKAAWYSPEDGLVVANSDGSGRVKMPPGLKAESLRMTARGDALVILVPEQGSIYALPADGSGLKRVTSVKEVSKVLGIEENNNHWRGGASGLDISDDGSRIAFHFLFDAFAVNGDGGGLRKLTEFGKTPDYSLTRARVSGDGRRIAWHNARGGESLLTVMDWDGGNRVAYSGKIVEGGDWMQFPRGGKIMLSWGLRLFDGDGKGKWDAADLGGSVGGPHPLARVKMATVSADLKRACIEIEGAESVDQGRPSQLMVVDFNPPSLNGVIPPGTIDVAPRFAMNDGSTHAVVSAQADDANLQYAGVMPMRDGFRLADWIGGNLPLRKQLGGSLADSADPLILRSNSGKPMPTGPVTLRVFTVGKDGNVLTVDLEGLEAKQP